MPKLLESYTAVSNIILSAPHLPPVFTICGWLLSINVVFHNMAKSLGTHTGSMTHAQFVSVQNTWAAVYSHGWESKGQDGLYLKE